MATKPRTSIPAGAEGAPGHPTTASSPLTDGLCRPPDRGIDPNEAVTEALPAQARTRSDNGGQQFAPPQLHPGEVLSGRFKILRFVAQGGMGEVYEAEDLRLNERVALKTVRPEIVSDPHAMERFTREVQLARRVTHPNVCRIFDICQHQSGPDAEGRPGPVTFLAMEYLPGETLEDTIRRTGKLDPDFTRPIALQMAAALAAAHGAGIVHRDFKSANVILTTAGTSPAGGRSQTPRPRAVVTDFGLAQVQGAGHGAERVTTVGWVVGTPAYMAPEQARGTPLTSAADIYSLGVVLHEMVTGVLPQTGDSPMALLLRRMTEPAKSPRTFVPDLDPVWEKVILRCLEIEPESRFQSAADVASALDVKKLAVTEVLPSSLLPRPANRRRRVYLAALLAMAFVVAGVLLVRWQRRSANWLAGKGRRSVAVLGFKNLSGRPDSAWLTTALSETLTSELAIGEALRVIPGEVVGRMKVDLSLPDAASLAPDTLARVRANIGADLVVLGSYLAAGKDAGGQIRLDIRLQEAGAGETLALLTETGTEAGILDLVSRCGAELRKKLRIREPGRAGANRGAFLPASPAASRLYAEGLSKLRSLDAVRARELLEKAVEADPVSPLARSALADALSALGFDLKAAEEAKRAHELAGDLPREQRLFVEGRYREEAREWQKAIEKAAGTSIQRSTDRSG